MLLRRRSPKEVARPEAQAVTLVEPVYYGSQVGHEFPNQAEALEHYLSEGWSSGLLPNPFVAADAVRSDADLASKLRQAVEDASRGKPIAPRWHLVRESVDLVDLLERHPEAPTHIGGIPGFLCGSARGRRVVKMRIGPPAPDPMPAIVPDTTALPRRIGWGGFRVLHQDAIALTELILREGPFDRAYYEAQTGLSFLSDEAALAHYVEIGEDQGWAPHPQFEPEWYAVHAAGARRNRRLLTHVAEGRSTSPVPATSADVARAVAFERLAAFAEAESARMPGAKVLPHHRRLDRKDLPDDPNLPMVVVIDARGLGHRHLEERFASVQAQTHDAWVGRVILDPACAGQDRTAALRLAELDERVEVVPSTETFGAAVDRVCRDARAVAFWDISQEWSAEHLMTHVAALAAAPNAAASVTVWPQRKHLWLTRTDPLWLEPSDAAGVVFRPEAFGMDDHFASPTLDHGIEWDLLLRVAADRQAVIVPGRTLRLRKGFTPVDRRWSRQVANRARSAEVLSGELLDRVPGRVSLLVPTFEDWWMTERAVRSALAAAGDLDVEVVVVDNGSRRSVTAVLALAFAEDERVHLHRLPVNGDFALGSNVALARSTGEFVVFLNNDTFATEGWLRPLIEALDTAAAAQPLLLYPDGVVQTAGTVFFGKPVPPTHLLAGHPKEDVDPGLADVNFNALTAACLAMRADDALRLGGFDLDYANGMEDVDLCLRLRASTDRPLRLVPKSVVHHDESRTPGRFARASLNREIFINRWREDLAGALDDRHVLDETHLRITGATSRPATTSPVRTGSLVVSRPARLVTRGEAAGLPALRWAIKNPAPGDPRGDLWGDTYFAAALARELRELGQEVVVDRRSAWVRPGSDQLDDVTLTLRGLVHFAPQPDATNLLWVISHPEDVGPAEIASGWDRIYAASSVWAEQMTETTHRDVVPLLQATDARRFTPDGDRIPSDVLFVGRTRGVERAIVRDAIAAGGDLSVYGDGWEHFIDPRYVREDHLDNNLVPLAYRGARIVLNDHWRDMAERGFWSNRVFDALACGALVVSDKVAGAADLAPGLRTYRDVEELRALLDPDNPTWPSREERTAWSDTVRREHSFAARARRLLADVLDVRGIEHSLG